MSDTNRQNELLLVENEQLQTLASQNEMQLLNVFHVVPVSAAANDVALAPHPAIVAPFGPGVVAPGEPLAT